MSYISPLRSQPRGERRMALWLLAVPLMGALLAFVVAVVTTLMGEMAQGSPRFYAAAFSYTLLVVCVMLLPAYLAGLAWYAWWTREGEAHRLRLGLLLAPLVALMCAWFPATLLPGLQPLGQAAGDPLRTYLMAGVMTLLLGYAWSLAVYLILRFWRRT